MNKERLTELSEKLLEIPNMISNHQNQVLDLNEKIQEISNEIGHIESSIKSEINSQIDENGKKVYSNEVAREAAFVEVASTNGELAAKKENLGIFQRELNTEKIRIEALGNEQRNIRSILYFFGGSEGDLI
jgi:predicted  nucleic acid-binding Zn-ribbon protein